MWKDFLLRIFSTPGEIKKDLFACTLSHAAREQTKKVMWNNFMSHFIAE
jgi:hypothetical protein